MSQQVNPHRLNAIIAELTEQRNIHGNRAANLAGALAEAQERIEQLEKEVESYENEKAPAPKAE